MKNRLWIVAVLICLCGTASAADDRGYLGVTIYSVQNVSEGKDQNGVYIDGIHKGSGAEAAGIEPRDQIVTIDGAAVETLEDLEAVLGTTRPGDEVAIRVLRNRVRKVVRVVLGELDDSLGIVESRPGPAENYRIVNRLKNVAVNFGGDKQVFVLAGSPGLGVEAIDLTGQLAGYFDVEAGVLVTEVSDVEPRLRAGDVIVEVDGVAVADIDDLDRAVRDQEVGTLVDVTIQGRGGLEVVSMPLVESAGSSISVALELADFGPNSATLELENGESGSLTISGGRLELTKLPDADSLKNEIRELEQRLERLREQLQRM